MALLMMATWIQHDTIIASKFSVFGLANYSLIVLIYFTAILTGLNKFNICMHWFLCMYNGFAHMFVHAKLCLYKTVIVGASLHHLIYIVRIQIAFITVA